LQLAYGANIAVERPVYCNTSFITKINLKRGFIKMSMQYCLKRILKMNLKSDCFFYKLRNIVALLIIFFILTSPALSANRLCFENFENVSEGVLPEINPTGKGEISRAARTFWGRDGIANGGVINSGGNHGKCAMAYVGPYINDRSYAEPKWRFDNKFNESQEVYVKFDIRIDPNLGTSHETREVNDFKIIRITDYSDAGAASSSQWHPQINFTPSSSSYRWYTWSQGGGYSEYYFSRATIKNANHMMDNNWHTYEIYINIGEHVANDRYDANADGIVRIWEDGALILEDITVPFRCSSSEGRGINSIAFMRHAKALGAPVSGMSGNIYFDNLEVWDGMPDGDGSTPVDNEPTVNITAPTSQSSYISNTDVVSLGGNANDDNEITSLTWSFNGADQGTVPGNWASWTLQDIPLDDGNNTIVVTAIDSASQLANDTITVSYTPDPPVTPDDDTVVSWRATEQTGDSVWDDSWATWCVRVPIEGSSITRAGNRIQLGFQGRISGNYILKKVSIAERDINGENGDVVDSTWVKVTFDSNSADSWDTDLTTVSPNTEKLSDPIILPYSLNPNKNYYITFMLESPSVYLRAPAYYYEMYFEDADHSDDLDWSSNGHTDRYTRLHALSSIHVGVAPADVSNFQANPGDCQVALSWINPGDDDFVGVNIRYRTDHYPEHYQDGVSVYNGSGISYNHSDLQNNIIYYYSAFTYDDKGNYSSTAHASATPQANPGTNQAPIVTITGSFTGEANSEVNFTSSVEDPDGQVIACHWDFGDGDGNDNCRTTSHIYSTPGSYTVTVTSTDDDGATGADSINVLISPDVTSPKIVSAVAVQ
jgi:hypothetical protein